MMSSFDMNLDMSWSALWTSSFSSRRTPGLPLDVGEADRDDEIERRSDRARRRTRLSGFLDVDGSPVRAEAERGDRELHVRAGVRQAVGEVARVPPKVKAAVFTVAHCLRPSPSTTITTGASVPGAALLAPVLFLIFCHSSLRSSPLTWKAGWRSSKGRICSIQKQNS